MKGTALRFRDKRRTLKIRKEEGGSLFHRRTQPELRRRKKSGAGAEGVGVGRGGGTALMQVWRVKNGVRSRAYVREKKGAYRSGQGRAKHLSLPSMGKRGGAKPRSM